MALGRLPAAAGSPSPRFAVEHHKEKMKMAPAPVVCPLDCTYEGWDILDGPVHREFKRYNRQLQRPTTMVGPKDSSNTGEAAAKTLRNSMDRALVATRNPRAGAIELNSSLHRPLHPPRFPLFRLVRE